MHADPHCLEGVDPAVATDPCMAGLCKQAFGEVRLGLMRGLLWYLRLSILHCRNHCGLWPDNLIVLQLRSGDHREHVLVGHCLMLNNVAHASLCWSLAR